MSVTSGDIVKDYYNIAPNRRVEVNLRSIKNKEQADEINTQCISDGRMERLKAAGTFIVGISATVALLGIAFLAAKISELVLGILFFPVSFFPPLYGFITLAGCTLIGGALAYITIKRYAKHFFDGSVEHWNYADHLFQQAHAVRLKRALLN